jgi:hypothetical protein
LLIPQILLYCNFYLKLGVAGAAVTEALKLPSMLLKRNIKLHSAFTFFATEVHILSSSINAPIFAHPWETAEKRGVF